MDRLLCGCVRVFVCMWCQVGVYLRHWSAERLMVRTPVTVIRSTTGVHSSDKGAKASPNDWARTETVVQPSLDRAERRQDTCGGRGRGEGW
jgi:hypothetical protein